MIIDLQPANHPSNDCMFVPPIRLPPYLSKETPTVRPAIAILKGTGNDRVPTPAFASLYRKLTSFLAEVFPPSENPQSLYPPPSADEFVSRRFATAPEFHRHLAQELWTLLREISGNKRQVNRKKLYDHQFAHLVWTAALLTDGPNSPTSFFIQGAPGTGKTLTLGVLMQACIRLQQRQLMNGKIAYCTAKPYHLSDKVRGKGMGHRRVLRTPPYTHSEKDINRLRLALCRMDKQFMQRLFSQEGLERIIRRAASLRRRGPPRHRRLLPNCRAERGRIGRDDVCQCGESPGVTRHHGARPVRRDRAADVAARAGRDSANRIPHRRRGLRDSSGLPGVRAGEHRHLDSVSR